MDVNKILNLLMWIFVLLSVVFVLWYVFGNSPSFEQTLLVFVLGVVVANFAGLRAIRAEHNNLRRSFCAMARDFKEHIRRG